MPLKIIVAGTGMRGSGYPNAENTLRILREHAEWQVDDRARWMPEGMALWKSARGSRVDLAISLLRLFLLNLNAAIRLVASREARALWVYAPYPSVFLLWWLSWAPRSCRPRVVADAYISLWDSAFRDRALASAGSWSARFAKWFEARALRTAAMVFVDTTANKDWMTKEFGIQPDKIHAVPLAIDDRVFAGTETPHAREHGETLRVCYVGTLVPLHGIEVVVGAVAQLAGDPAFEFQFVGDGQQSGMLQALLDRSERGVSWQRSWLPARGVAELLGQADLSLGVFGGTGKAGRVLPLKIYLSLAAGTPVLTQQEYSLPENVPTPPIFTVQPDLGQVARKLVELGNDRQQLARAAVASREYYRDHLGPWAIVKAWSARLGATGRCDSE